MDDPRTQPPINGPEAGVLRGFLDHHRDTLRMKTDGLDDDWEADDDWDWHSAAQDSPEQLHALLEASIAVSDRLLTEALTAPEGLDAPSSMESRRLPGERYSLRWVLVHLIEDYSRHHGHADLVRESIDGAVGE